ncbi:MAG: hypothetical protein HYV09_06560 [Deltaproteobacteria bacterium]|nr:hypothetical protein [Deltaproteobacteria bacterium]
MRTRTFLHPSLLVVFALSAVGAAGCDRHDKKKTDKSDQATEPAFVPKGAKGAGGGKSKGGKEADPSSLDDANLVADLGFRPTVDGFQFPNFRLDDPDDLQLGPADLKKMCGEKAVCAGGGDGDDGECTLKSGAQAFLDASAKLLRGGHCEGFSVGSLRLWAGEDSVSKLGGDKTYDLDRDKKSERYLAYWAVTQMSPSVAHATYRAAPNKVLERLISSMKKKNEVYLLGIHSPTGYGGHAIAPYAVEDRGDDIYWVYVYENNSPGKLRHVEFDKGKNTWRYDDAATSPDESASTYYGTASSPRIELVPQSARKKMSCPFAAGSSADDDDDEEETPKVAKKKPKAVEDDDDEDEPKVAKKKEKPADDDEIDGDGEDGDDDVMVIGRGAASLSVQDDSGHTLGMKDGNIVNEIPGATYVMPRGKLASDSPPILFIPAKTKVKLTVRGTEGQKDDVSIIGKKFTATLTGVSLEAKPAQSVEIDGKHKQLAFVGGAPVAQKIELFVDKGKKVEKLEIPKLLPIVAGGKLQIDAKAGKLALSDGKGGALKPLAAPIVVIKAQPMKKLPPLDAVGTGKLAPIGGPKAAPGAAPDKPGVVGPLKPGAPKPGAIEPVKPEGPAGKPEGGPATKSPALEPVKPGMPKPGAIEPVKPGPKPEPPAGKLGGVPAKPAGPSALEPVKPKPKIGGIAPVTKN